ncbi:MAG TPA: hypothetical protein PLM53_11005 [Spirochaetota bacterium]|nr:hypothetical protein [Spirochaetota bacterium]HPC41476.1 hypothetical protein [Spirochaetota bacterium]HPL19300.1 hypothetical protein [Spirochaetota bacterium]HQF09156.1 hypothetical protein [Spirochaetota bacterium]HQH97619.1 hypothetical protein [Spirochaetota bacterium]
MIVVLLLTILCLSIVLHVIYLLKYIRIRTESYLRKYINTAAVNLVTAGICIVIAIFYPEEIRKIQGPNLIWLVSGVFMILTLVLQTSIFVRVYRRSKLPEHYHYNFFGKKVLHSSVARPMEVALFFASIPMFLVAGAYFVARFIRFFI